MARSSAEAKYRTITSTASESIWIKQLLRNMRLKVDESMRMFCDNQAGDTLLRIRCFMK
jgi:hypothetical protein